ncbi:penicillin-binding protein activator [Arenicella sp. 4NH20-0111]|uniref:penicillin-binding protein activator n=1 Tax=Arenicella sp. 4NH20-0111 TaxID=3127648 RepID=UPI0033422D2C
MHSLLPVRQYLTPPSSDIFSRLTIAVGVILILGGCASTERQASDVEVRDVLPSQQNGPEEGESNAYDDGPALIVSSVGDDEGSREAARAEFYQQQAQNQSDEYSKIESNLNSAEYYVQAGQHERAADIVNAIRLRISDPIQLDRASVILAYADYASGDYSVALARLSRLIEPNPTTSINESDFKQGEEQAAQDVSVEQESDGLDADVTERNYIVDDIALPDQEQLSIQQVDALLLASFCHQALGNNEAAIGVLLRRETALYGAARAETTRYIWQVISALPDEAKQALADHSRNIQVRNRVMQSLGGEIGQVEKQPQQFNQWREDLTSLDGASVIDSGWEQRSPRSIFVLLPLSSRYAKAAQAVKAGIERQHDENQSIYQPSLSFYDIGDNPLQIGQYYAAAVRSGADFIIGPLGKDYSNEATNNSAYFSDSRYGAQVPMLMLGGDLPLTSNNLRFDMSPEIEGQHVADRAWKEGYLSAGIITHNSRRAQRISQGFVNRWLSLGGKLGKSVQYSEQQYDHSVELKQLFNIQVSEYRHRKLSQALGFKPKFAPYQRGDIDFVFMIADNKTGRILRPQINFFTNSQMPVYSTSALYNGIEDTINNMDLDSTLFPVMPWVVKSGQASQYAGQLNMLHAMGMDAYKIAGNLPRLTADSNAAINGATGQLQINGRQEITYDPVWAKFTNGELEVVDSLGLDIEPIINADDLEGADGEPFNSSNQSKGSYNDQNWDAGKSRRKTGR